MSDREPLRTVHDTQLFRFFRYASTVALVSGLLASFLIPPVVYYLVLLEYGLWWAIASIIPGLISSIFLWFVLGILALGRDFIVDAWKLQNTTFHLNDCDR